MSTGDWPEIRCIRGASLRVRLPPGKAVQVGPSWSTELCLPEAPCGGSITWDSGEVVLEPEQGADGFAAATGPIRGPTRLNRGEEITLGPYALVLCWPEDEPAEATRESQAGVAAGSAGRAQVLAGEHETTRVELRSGISIGSDAACDYRVVRAGAAPPRRAYCANVAASTGGFQIEASGFEERGVLLNGQLFSRRELVFGDYLQVGPICFRYDGEGGLVPNASSLGASLDARQLAVSFDGGARWVLDGASLTVPAGHFVGILGPSGSGKTTLLKAVSNLLEPARGEVLLDGRPIPASPSERRSLIGFVPQDDIVHLELSVGQALHFGARLRLSDSIPDHEIEKLIERVVGRIFFQLQDRDFETTDAAMRQRIRGRIGALLVQRVGELSGGQRKRVSVAVELMSRPRILFLDEPTSGLDPASELELMSMLRDVTNAGCSVVCTTHVMENVWRMHSFAVMHGGRVVFQGDSAAARSHFGVRELSAIYRALEDHPARWQQPAPEPPASQPSAESAPAGPAVSRKSRIGQAMVLLQRQLELFRRDRLSLALLVGQPLIIGAVLSLVAVDERAIPYKLFFGLVVAFWFGCSNAAPQIVREKAILFRERGVGLGLDSYLTAKFLFFGTLTVVQVVGLWLILSLRLYPGVGAYPPGREFAGWLLGAFWQALATAGIALCATAWGLAVSGWARRPAQASFIVPLLVIPQILFSGFVFPLGDWRTRDDDPGRVQAGKVLVRGVARLVPGYAGQRLVETSLAWDQDESGRKEDARERAFENLEVLSEPEEWTAFVNGRERGVTWRNPRPALSSLASLAAWTVLSLLFAALGLKRYRGWAGRAACVQSGTGMTGAARRVDATRDR